MPIESNCPGCGTKVRVPDSLLGKRVKCPSCNQIFKAEAPEAGFEEVIEDEPRPAKRRPAPVDDYDDDDDNQQEEDYEPRRRPRRGGRRAAQDAVKGPAISLMIVGGLALLLALLNLLVILLGRGQLFDPRNQPQGFGMQAQQGMQPMMVVFGFVPVIWGIIVPYAGYLMMNLRNRSSVMIGVIFAMVPCNIGCLLGLPFGIWALVVLNRPEVARAFDR